MEYNKLVRDRIPAIIAAQGAHAHTRVLSDAEYRECLEKKLDEEVAEYHESKSLEELADVLEVLFALTEVGGHSREELFSVCDNKREKRGAFSDRIFLISAD